MRSKILTSQLPVSRWHEQIGDPILADGILNRVVHNAHRIEMRGDAQESGDAKHVDSAHTPLAPVAPLIRRTPRHDWGGRKGSKRLNLAQADSRRRQ